jgi:organic radical activating enzyme
MSNLKQLNFNLSETPPKISQWFVSLEGEGSAIGRPSLYMRLAGCYSAACSFCDTKFSWGEAPGFNEIGNRDITLQIAEQLRTTTPKRLTITGGEPLHYIEFFPDIFRWVNSISPVGIDFFGIESNGNLLQDKNHCMDIIRNFNEIITEFNVFPTLTISPKLDAKTCYENQLTQQKVDKMYFDTFKNIADYLKQYPVYFKFIYDFTEEFIDFEHEKLFIDYLLDDLNVSREKIMLMPFTPDDPLDKDKDFWEKSKDATSRKSLELGITYSPRIHIDRKLD